MTPEEFVRVAKVQTSDAAVKGTLAVLKRPPGRRPRENDVRLSQWYNSLKSEDQEMLGRALKEAAELAAFEFFCILDGVTAVEDSADKGDLELLYVKGPTRTRINDPQEEELHNLFNRLCEAGTSDPPQEHELSAGDCGEARQLKAGLRVGDEIDIHHTPDKHASASSTPGYDPESGPAIALRKSEHRKVGLP